MIRGVLVKEACRNLIEDTAVFGVPNCQVPLGLMSKKGEGHLEND